MKFNMHNMDGQIVVSMDDEFAEALLKGDERLDTRAEEQAYVAFRAELRKQLHFTRRFQNHGSRS